MEISEALIQQIEQEVRNVLAKQSLTTPVPGSRQGALAVLDAAEVDFDPILQQFQSLVQERCHVVVIVSSLAAQVFDMPKLRAICGDGCVVMCDAVKDIRRFLSDFQTVVLPVLSHSLAAKLSLGITDSPGAYIAFQALLRGDRVIAVENVPSHAPPALMALQQNHLKSLKRFGVHFVTVDQLAETILGDEAASAAVTKLVSGKTVISASVIANLSPTVTEFVYSNPAVITPLARDLAVQRGIRLVAKSSREP